MGLMACGKTFFLVLSGCCQEDGDALTDRGGQFGLPGFIWTGGGLG